MAKKTKVAKAGVKKERHARTADVKYVRDHYIAREDFNTIAKYAALPIEYATRDCCPGDEHDDILNQLRYREGTYQRGGEAGGIDGDKFDRFVWYYEQAGVKYMHVVGLWIFVDDEDDRIEYDPRCLDRAKELVNKGWMADKEFGDIEWSPDKASYLQFVVATVTTIHRLLA